MTEADKSAISRRRCREIMTKSVRTATPDMSLRDVAILMRDGDMGAVPVVEDGKLIGIVTDRESFEATPVFFARVLCPICRTEHEWFAKEAWLCEPGLRGRKPARLQPPSSRR